MGIIGGAKNVLKGREYFVKIGKLGGKALKILLIEEDDLESYFAVRGRKGNPRTRPYKLSRRKKRG